MRRCALAGLFAALLSATAPALAATPTQSTCSSYLATSPNPAGIAAVSGPGVAQRSAFLADGGKLVAIGSRYYSVSIPTGFYSSSNPVVIFDLHGTGGYPEAEWSDWHTAMSERGYAFIGLSWGGGTPSAATDTEIYSLVQQIFSEVGAYCPLANANKWLLGFSVGSAMSFAVAIRDVADQKLFRGQIAVSGAAIGPLTTGKDVMHPTVEANRSNGNAMRGVNSWMYCGDKDFDHSWSMCTEMPNGEAFVNEHGGQATLYKDPDGEHHSLPTSSTPRTAMLDYVATISAQKSDVLSFKQTDCLLNWGEDALPALLSPKRSGSRTVSPFYYRYYATTNTYLGMSTSNNHLYFVDGKTPTQVNDLGLASKYVDQALCR